MKKCIVFSLIMAALTVMLKTSFLLVISRLNIIGKYVNYCEYFIMIAKTETIKGDK